MKKLFKVCLLLICFGLFSCGAVRMTTEIGGIVGKSFQESAMNGEITAEQSIEAWPYASGLIKSLLAEKYELEMPNTFKNVMADLDKLAAKRDPLTSEEKGQVIGSYVRLELLGYELDWDKYGVNLMSLITTFIGI